MIDIKNQILSNSKRGKPLGPSDLATIHHQFMLVYGWIPFDEFFSEETKMHRIFALYPMVQDELRKREEWRVLTVRGVTGNKKYK